MNLVSRSMNPKDKHKQKAYQEKSEPNCLRKSDN